MHFILLTLAGGILVSALILLKKSVTLSTGSIDLVRWHIGFVGLYLGGGGLWALLTMSEESYAWAVSYYEITPSGIWLTAASWVLVLAATYVCVGIMPCKVDLRGLALSTDNNRVLRGSIVALSVLVTVGLITGYTTGNLGYMGQKVGDDVSGFRINPVFDFVLALYPAVAAWGARHLFDARLSLMSVAVGAALLALGVPVGRRIFLAAVLTALTLSYCRNPQFTARRSIAVLVLAAFAYAGMIMFFNLRQVEEAKPVRAAESRTDLFALLPDAFALAISEPDAATKEIAIRRKENESRRPFFMLGFFIYCAEGYASGLANKGMLTLSSMLVAVPSVLFPSKDAFLEEYQEEERFVERDFGIPVTLDESPTLPSSGLINLGMLGVVIQVCLFAGTTFVALKLLNVVAGTPFAVFGVTYLIVSLQLAEAGSAGLFTRLRLVFMLAVCGYLWALAFRPNTYIAK
jgi:hypothetical protein